MDDSAVIFFAVFFTELLLLSFFSRLLTMSLAKLFYRFTRSRETIINILAIIFWPGTAVHELAHVITAGVLMVHVGNITLTPEIDGEHITLGQAEVGKTDPFRQLLIGIAPVFWGLGIIIGSLWYFSSQGGIILWQIVLLLYLVFVIANSMFASQKDMEGSLIIFLLIIAILAALYLLKIDALFIWLESLMTENLAQFLQKVDILLGIPLGIDLFVYTLTQVISGRR